ncbi:hypothetical protein B0A48_14500 [Cryoendolithus antarcticus]|uniref:Uncharacterized protein n=1 Tax=Cryoendolithus antarcticus TaxID=1507870 RepID=A0A1V8SLB4_9PEZI|nr:hypothetical protein B0A48_14500 [Cryoendolithus antarcticus]
MESDPERGRGLRRNRSRELLSKLLPGNISRTLLSTDDPKRNNTASGSASAPGTARGRSRSAGNRLSRLVHNVSTLDFGGMFASGDDESSEQPSEKRSEAPVLAPILMAGPSLGTNIRRVEAGHPSQWPGAVAQGRVQLASVDAELLHEVRKRRSVLAEANGSEMSLAAVTAAVNGIAGPSAGRAREAEPRSIAQVLRSDQPCNLAFTLQTEVSILQRKLAARETQCHDQAAHISDLQSTLAASYLSASETVAENRALKEEIKRLSEKIEEMEMVAGTMREDSKMEMREAVIAGAPSAAAIVAESAKEVSAVDVAWTFRLYPQGGKENVGRRQEIEEVAPEERPMNANPDKTEAAIIESSSDGHSSGKHASLIADEIARIQARAVIPNSNEDAAIESWAQEELKLAIMGLIFAADGGHPALRL